jgi:hypothetical protein
MALVSLARMYIEPSSLESICLGFEPAYGLPLDVSWNGQASILACLRLSTVLIFQVLLYRRWHRCSVTLGWHMHASNINCRTGSNRWVGRCGSLNVHPPLIERKWTTNSAGCSPIRQTFAPPRSHQSCCTSSPLVGAHWTTWCPMCRPIAV